MKEQIEFDFSKWGQPGITVEIVNIKYNIATLHQIPNNTDRFYGVYTNGQTFDWHKDFLFMYYEQIPREFYINVYPGNRFQNTVSGAYTNYDQAKSNCNSNGKTTTFREVIE